MTVLDAILGTLLVVFVAVSIVLSYLARTYYGRWRTRQSNAYQMGGRQVRGDMYQLLGEFAVLDEYEQVITLSTTSKQASLDLIGVKADSIDFIEFKKKGAMLKGPERKIQRLVREKKVEYVIKDVDLPQGTSISDRSDQS